MVGGVMSRRERRKRGEIDRYTAGSRGRTQGGGGFCTAMYLRGDLKNSLAISRGGGNKPDTCGASNTSNAAMQPKPETATQRAVPKPTLWLVARYWRKS
jgi:hypothetical protein